MFEKKPIVNVLAVKFYASFFVGLKVMIALLVIRAKVFMS
jgi:hypothetical protein